MSKPRFTPEQHHEIGRQLKSLRDGVLDALVQVHHAYPKTGPEAKALTLALRKLDSARCALDSAFCNEHRDAFSTRAYYPGPAEN